LSSHADKGTAQNLRKGIVYEPKDIKKRLTT